MDVAIHVDKVTKVFTPPRYVQSGVKELLLHPFRTIAQARAARFTAVDDVSLTVRRGETHGIIGRNGAGKSTLLAMIGGVVRPTSGTVRVQGRISPLLELGVGFVQELSADENVILNGVLLGMRRAEMERRLDQVIRFAEIDEFRNQPIKTFSSGMYARLGFSIAVHADPDVLLVDEVLAVGDMRFQERCLERIGELRKGGATILLVSHDLNNVTRICEKATWIEAGRVAASGDAMDVARKYCEGVGSELPIGLQAFGDGS